MERRKSLPRGPKTNIAALLGYVECVESREEPKRDGKEGGEGRGRRNRERSAKGTASLLEGVDTGLIPAFVNAFLIDALGTSPSPRKRSRAFEDTESRLNFRLHPLCVISPILLNHYPSLRSLSLSGARSGKSRDLATDEGIPVFREIDLFFRILKKKVEKK